MKKLLLIAKFLLIIFFGVIYYTSAQSFSSYDKHAGKGELKLTKFAFDLLEFYFSTGRYGELYNDPPDYLKKMTKTVWKPMFIIFSKNSKGMYWYYLPMHINPDMNPNYVGKARIKCTKQGYGECFIFAIKDKIVWQNGINPKKGTRIKKKEARKGVLSAKLKELGFYDGGITETKKIEKKETKKKTTQTDNSNDIVQELKDLKELYESGVLSKEEFEKAKKKLLN